MKIRVQFHRILLCLKYLMLELFSTPILLADWVGFGKTRAPLKRIIEERSRGMIADPEILKS